MTDPDALPDDAPTLKATVASQRMEIARQRAEIAHLTLWVAKLRRHRFGRRSGRTGKPLDQLERVCQISCVNAVLVIAKQNSNDYI